MSARAGRAAERLQAEASAKSTKATTIHRLLNYKSWSQRRQGADKESAEVRLPQGSVPPIDICNCHNGQVEESLGFMTC